MPRFLRGNLLPPNRYPRLETMMRKTAKAAHCRELMRELSLRDSEALHLSDAADRLERQEQATMARAIRDMWRHNEVERIKLQAQIDALDG